MNFKRIVWAMLGALALVPGVPLAQLRATVAPAGGKELVAIMEFAAEGASKAEVAALTDRLQDLLLKSGEFTLVDRSQMEAILKEQAFQQTGCTSQECAVKVGKVLGVKKIVVGRVIKLSDTTWQLAAQLLDVETAETVRAESLPHRGDFFSLLDVATVTLAARLAGKVGSVAPPVAQPQQSKQAQPTVGPPKSGKVRSVAPPVAQPQQSKQAQPPVGSAVPNNVWRDSITGMEFVFVPGGSFEMGCGLWNRNCNQYNEKPAHQVSISSFWMGKTEVTVGAFRRFVKQASYVTEAERSEGCSVISSGKVEQQEDKSWKNPGFSQTDNHPVACISWNDAVAFAEWLSRESNQRIRLPTEAEWEYACRAGGKEQLYGTQSGALSLAKPNTGVAGTNPALPVASYAPNGLGLYGMSSNVWEWVQDAYDSRAYAHAAAVDPLNNSGNIRVIRDGTFIHFDEPARCSSRDSTAPSLAYGFLGFRVARAN